MSPLKLTLGLVLSLSLVACGGGSTSQPPPVAQQPQTDIKIFAPASLELEKGSDSSFNLSVTTTGLPANQPYEVNIIFPTTTALSVVSIMPKNGVQYITLRADEQASDGSFGGIITVKSGTTTVTTPISITIKSKVTGSYYASFGENGLALLDLPTGATINSATNVAVDAQGRILALGFTQLSRGTDTAFTVTRFLNSGSLDKSFGNNGSVLFNPTDNREVGSKIYATPKGDVLILGYHNGVFGVVRLLENGKVDPSSAPLGTVASYGYGDSFSSSQGPDGKIFVALYSMLENHFVILRLNADGSLDSTFVANGFTVKSNVFQTSFKIVSLSNGDAIIAANEYNADRNILLTKFKASRELDQGFGSNGQISIDLGSNDDTLSSFTVDSQDRVLIQGKTKNLDTVLLKFTKDGDLVTSFGQNGKIILTEDQDVFLNSAMSKGDDVVLYNAFTTKESAALKIAADGKLNRFTFKYPQGLEKGTTDLYEIIWSEKLNRFIGFGNLDNHNIDPSTSRGAVYTFSP